MIKQKLLCKILTFVNFALLIPYIPLVANEQPILTAKPFDLKSLELTTAPKPADWQAFMREPEAVIIAFLHKQQLLTTTGDLVHKKIGWEWRLGLIRKCQKSNDPDCRRILVSTLNDPAMVVRNEAVTAFARRYQGSENEEALRILEHVFQDPKNSRRGEPLFVQKKILFAIHEIGGLQARSLGHRLSSKNAGLKSYWAKLQ